MGEVKKCLMCQVMMSSRETKQRIMGYVILERKKQGFTDKRSEGYEGLQKPRSHDRSFWHFEEHTEANETE